MSSLVCTKNDFKRAIQRNTIRTYTRHSQPPIRPHSHHLQHPVNWWLGLAFESLRITVRSLAEHRRADPIGKFSQPENSSPSLARVARLLAVSV